MGIACVCVEGYLPDERLKHDRKNGQSDHIIIKSCFFHQSKNRWRSMMVMIDRRFFICCTAGSRISFLASGDPCRCPGIVCGWIPSGPKNAGWKTRRGKYGTGRVAPDRSGSRSRKIGIGRGHLPLYGVRFPASNLCDTLRRLPEKKAPGMSSRRLRWFTVERLCRYSRQWPGPYPMPISLPPRMPCRP